VKAKSTVSCIAWFAFAGAAHVFASGSTAPDVYGLSSADAIRAFRGAGFTGSMTATDGDSGATIPAAGLSTDFVTWQSVAAGASADSGAPVSLVAFARRETPNLETDSSGAPLPVATAAAIAWAAGRFRLGTYDPADPAHVVPVVPASGMTGTVKSGSQKPTKASKVEVGGIIGIIIDPPAVSGGGDTLTLMILAAAAGAVAGAAAAAAASARKREE
jgi:hypothetical protein